MFWIDKKLKSLVILFIVLMFITKAHGNNITVNGSVIFSHEFDGDCDGMILKVINDSSYFTPDVYTLYGPPTNYGPNDAVSISTKIINSPMKLEDCAKQCADNFSCTGFSYNDQYATPAVPNHYGTFQANSMCYLKTLTKSCTSQERVFNGFQYYHILASCGNARVEGNEACDLGAANNTGVFGCTAQCTVATTPPSPITGWSCKTGDEAVKLQNDIMIPNYNYLKLATTKADFINNKCSEGVTNSFCQDYKRKYLEFMALNRTFKVDCGSANEPPVILGSVSTWPGAPSGGLTIPGPGPSDLNCLP